MSARHGHGLGGKMFVKLASAAVIEGPTEAVGKVPGGPLQVSNDGAEGPLCSRRDGWLITWRQVAQNDVDARRLVFTVPGRRQTAGKAKASWATLCRNQPDDIAAGPSAALTQEHARIRERGSDIGGQHGVCGSFGQIGLLPPHWQKVRRRQERAQALLHPHVRLHGDPGCKRIAHGLTELPAPGADIKQVANARHCRSKKWCDMRDVVGCVDAGRVEFKRIDSDLARLRRRNAEGSYGCAILFHRSFPEP
ncbi:hypothetical protein AX289_26185 [Methylorubrum populi]|nr:hypothetical protein AX289_26185 [Methylorubrum populi]